MMVPGEYLQPEELRERLRTPDALLEHVLTRLDELEQTVTTQAVERRLSICPDADDPGRYQCGPMANGEGHAMYDTCVRRSLYDDEIAETLQELHHEVAAQRIYVSEHYVEIHRAAMRVLPRDECWLLIPP